MTIELQRELHNHSTFHHPNVIQFRQVVLTRSHIGLVMEYASGGDLFKRVENSGCLPVNLFPAQRSHKFDVLYFCIHISIASTSTGSNAH